MKLLKYINVKIEKCVNFNNLRNIKNLKFKIKTKIYKTTNFYLKIPHNEEPADEISSMGDHGRYGKRCLTAGVVL